MPEQNLPLVVHIDAKESSLELERVALAGIDCEIVSIAVSSEGEIIEAVKNATVILNDHSPVTQAMIDQLTNCKLITVEKAQIWKNNWNSPLSNPLKSKECCKKEYRTLFSRTQQG